MNSKIYAVWAGNNSGKTDYIGEVRLSLASLADKIELIYFGYRRSYRLLPD